MLLLHISMCDMQGENKIVIFLLHCGNIFIWNFPKIRNGSHYRRKIIDNLYLKYYNMCTVWHLCAAFFFETILPVTDTAKQTKCWDHKVYDKVNNQSRSHSSQKSEELEWKGWKYGVVMSNLLKQNLKKNRNVRLLQFYAKKCLSRKPYCLISSLKLYV